MPRDANEIYRQKLREKLSAAVSDAIPLAVVGDFDGAELMIRAIESDVDGWLAMARLYIAAIARLGGEKAAATDRDRVHAMFDRAVAHLEHAYPMPHTQDEADAYEQGKAQDRDRVAKEVGCDPSQWPSADA